MIRLQDIPIELQEDVPLAGFTSIGLGGKAKRFATVRSVRELQTALRWAEQAGVPAWILGGGSNTLFADEGFDGLIVKNALHHIRFHSEGSEVIVRAGAGVVWDELVALTIEKGLAGFECMSGIPGLVGAVPIQNVGAYGQEVAETIVSVGAIDNQTLKPVCFPGEMCQFGYRDSRFKSAERGRYTITWVSFRLYKGDPQPPRYRDLEERIDAAAFHAASAQEKLAMIRSEVLAVRKVKSMVIDPSDENTRSLGSFFTNPILTGKEFKAVEAKLKTALQPGEASFPQYKVDGGVKLSAAWLVERAGFQRGYRKGGVGISSNHCLALINHSGTTKELLELRDDIQKGVFRRFGVSLAMEPVLCSIDEARVLWVR